MGESPPPEHTEEPPATGRRRWSLLSHLLALVVAVAVSIASYATVQGYNDARRRASAQLRETVGLAARAVRQDLEEVATQTATILPSLAPAFAAAAGAGVPLADVCELTFAPLPVFPAGAQPPRRQQGRLVHVEALRPRNRLWGRAMVRRVGHRPGRGHPGGSPPRRALHRVRLDGGHRTGRQRHPRHPRPRGAGREALDPEHPGQGGDIVGTGLQPEWAVGVDALAVAR